MAIAADPVLHQAYVVNRDSATVSVIGGLTRQVVATIPVGAKPAAVAVDTSTHAVYVTNSGSDSLTVIDGTTNQVTATVPTAKAPRALAVDSSAHRVYIADDSGFVGQAQAFDGQTHQALGTFTLGLDFQAGLLAVDAGTHALYVFTGDFGDHPGMITMVDGATMQPIARTNSGVPFGAAVDSSTHHIFAATHSGFLVADGSSPQTFQQNPLFVANFRSGFFPPVDVALDPATHVLYLATPASSGNMASTVVSAVDEPTLTVVASTTVNAHPGSAQYPPGDARIAVDSSLHEVYVADRQTNSVAVVAGLSQPSGLSQPGPVVHDARYFAQTGFRIDNDTIWDYFNRRGGIDTFGYPTSRTFTLQGFAVQFFQRRIVQLGPDGQARLLNLLDPGLLPYNSFNGSTFPSVDAQLASTAPNPADLPATLGFVQRLAPDLVGQAHVNFYQTFLNTVSPRVAFPNGGSTPGLLAGLDLEMWGIPTSGVYLDPNNHNFIYLRWQRGIMHYDASCTCTQGILLADYLKAILTGQNLPADLAAEAAGSPFLGQYDPGQPNWVRDPARLPNTDLTTAFSQG